MLDLWRITADVCKVSSSALGLVVLTPSRLSTTTQKLIHANQRSNNAHVEEDVVRFNMIQHKKREAIQVFAFFLFEEVTKKCSKSFNRNLP